MVKELKNANKPHKAWYLLPILFGLLGGIAAYFLLRKRNNKVAKRMIIVGIVMIPVNLVINPLLGIILGTEYPIVCMESRSMQHDYAEAHYDWLESRFGYSRGIIDSWPFKNGFSMGDILVIQGSSNYSLGDVILFRLKGISMSEYPRFREALIPHRVVESLPDGSFQTKGDGNKDQLPGEKSINREITYGKVIYIIPQACSLRLLLKI